MPAVRLPRESARRPINARPGAVFPNVYAESPKIGTGRAMRTDLKMRVFLGAIELAALVKFKYTSNFNPHWIEETRARVDAQSDGIAEENLERFGMHVWISKDGRCRIDLVQFSAGGAQELLVHRARCVQDGHGAHDDGDIARAGVHYNCSTATFPSQVLCPPNCTYFDCDGRVGVLTTRRAGVELILSAPFASGLVSQELYAGMGPFGRRLGRPRWPRCRRI